MMIDSGNVNRSSEALIPDGACEYTTIKPKYNKRTKHTGNKCRGLNEIIYDGEEVGATNASMRGVTTGGRVSTWKALPSFGESGTTLAAFGDG